MIKESSRHGGGGLSLRHPVVLIAVIVAGALLGSFLGKFIAAYSAPDSVMQTLFSEQIKAGLQPTVLDLRILDLTFGCEFKLNVTSLIGILASALVFKGVFR